MLRGSQREHVLATSHQATQPTRRQDQEDFAPVLEIPRSTGRFLLPQVKALKHGSRVRRTRNQQHPVMYPGRTPRRLAIVAIAVGANLSVGSDLLFKTGTNQLANWLADKIKKNAYCEENSCG